MWWHETLEVGYNGRYAYHSGLTTLFCCSVWCSKCTPHHSLFVFKFQDLRQRGSWVALRSTPYPFWVSPAVTILKLVPSLVCILCQSLKLVIVWILSLVLMAAIWTSTMHLRLGFLLGFSGIKPGLNVFLVLQMDTLCSNVGLGESSHVLWVVNMFMFWLRQQHHCLKWCKAWVIRLCKL